MRTIVFFVVMLLSACGGSDGTPGTVAFYGDSITAGRTEDIAQKAFRTQDFAVPAQNSDAPLNEHDTSTVAVLRYGMADVVHGIPPSVTRQNLIRLIDKLRLMGKTPVVVNISRTESGMERPTNDAIRDITTIDVTDIPGGTVDGIHPTEEYHSRLNRRIHERLTNTLRY